MLDNLCEKSYVAEARYANFYTGGDIAWSADGSQMFCLNSNEINVVDVATGQVVQRFSTNSNSNEQQKEKVDVDDDVEVDPTYTFALSSDHLATAHRSGLIRLWDLSTCKLVKLWKAQHKGPIVKLAFSACGKIICSSGGESTLRLWDFTRSSCLGVLSDFSGPATLLAFHPNMLKTEIYAVGADNSVCCWNYESKQLIRQLRGHLSQVTGLSFENAEENCQHLVTVSRDKVLILWQLEADNGATQLKVLPLYEELTGVAYLHKGQQLSVLCANGKLLSIDIKTWQITKLLDASDIEVSSLLRCAQNEAELEQLAVVTAEQNILIYRYETTTRNISCIKQLIGNNDEILDMCFLGAGERYLVVATNSKHFKIYDTEKNMNCKLITGHNDTVMSLTAAQNQLLTAGKDCSIMLWQLVTDDAENFELTCLTQQASCHTSSIGCIAFAQQADSGFASVCQDGSMKVWQLLKDKADKKYTFGIRYAALAHDKEINCVSYAPNSKIIATSSQDKTAKLWRHDANVTLGVLRGHTRGVSCVLFSPIDQIVLTSAFDCSLRIWSIANFACLKRLEQECTVLRAEFIDSGKFIVSAGSDGLLKLWNVKNNTCVHTLDEHSDRVWTLAVPKHTNKYFYSGGSDSRLVRYADTTQITRNEAIDKRQATLQQEQTLQLLLHQRQQLEKAFLLALNLNKPKASYDIINHYVRARDEASIGRIVAELSIDQRVSLLEHVKAWSTNSRHAQVSNLILKHLLGGTFAESTTHLKNYSNMVEVLTPYVQRHFRRVTELNKELAYLEFVLKCM